MLPDLRKLRHVVGVAEAGSFTAAATALAISQPALTRSVAEVEHLLDLKLFHRLPRGVRLTDAGEAFVRRAQRVLADAEDLMDDLASLRSLRRGRLRIGVAPAAFMNLVERPVAAFARVYPGVRIEITEVDMEAVPRLLADGVIDLAAGESNYLGAWTELATETIAPLQDCVILRTEHPLASQGAVSAEDLLAYPMVLPTNRYPTEQELTEVFQQAGLSPRPPHYRCDSVDLVRRLVLETDAFAPLLTLAGPREDLRQRFLVLEGVLPLRAHALGLAVLERGEASPTVGAFRDIFRAFGGGAGARRA